MEEGKLLALGRHMKSFGGSSGGENKWLLVPVTNGEQAPSNEENKLFKSAMSDLKHWISTFSFSISVVHLWSINKIINKRSD